MTLLYKSSHQDSFIVVVLAWTWRNTVTNSSGLPRTDLTPDFFFFFFLFHAMNYLITTYRRNDSTSNGLKTFHWHLFSKLRKWQGIRGLERIQETIVRQYLATPYISSTLDSTEDNNIILKKNFKKPGLKSNHKSDSQQNKILGKP